MTPLEAIGYAFAALIVSPVAIGLLILALMVLLMLGIFIWESRKAQVALVVAALIYGGTRLVMWDASRPPSPPESCSQRCDNYTYENNRRDCLRHSYEAQKLIQENEGVKP